MKRPIKFRGRATTLEVGKMVYGDITHDLYNGKPAICDNLTQEYYVDPDSVAQLVGYDKNGNEVYEDDELIDENGRKYCAVLTSQVSAHWCPSFRLPLVIGDTCEYTLEQKAQMKRPIKFRGVVISRRAAEGREADIGDIVTGSLIIEDYDTVQLCWIRQKKENFAAIDYPVDPDTVVQFIGVDKDGNEVYEGDEVVSEYGDSVIARLVDNLPPKATLQEAEKC